MEKILKEFWPIITILFSIIFLLPLALMIYAKITNQTSNLSFTLYLGTIGVLSAVIFGFILFIALILACTQLLTKFLNNTHDKNAKKAILEKFNLTPNSFKEIDVEFTDNEETRTFFIEVINHLIDISDDDSYFGLKIQAKINGNNYNIPLDENIITSAIFINILKKLGCKYYLHLDENEKFIWYIKTSNNEILHEEEIENYDFILMSFTPKE